MDRTTEEELEKRRKKDRQKRRTPKVSASIDPCKFRGIVEMNPKEWEDVSGK